MMIAVIGFALGVCLLQSRASLPEVWILMSMTLAAAVGFAWGWRQRSAWREGARARVRAGVLLLCGLALGFGYAAWRAEVRLGDALPEAWQGRDVVVHGVVSGLPQRRDRSLRFELVVSSAHAPEPGAGGGPPEAVPVPGRIMLSWYPARGRDAAALPDLGPGERWTLTVRLRRPHGFSNPDGFDYEAWLLERGIRATGYVRPQGVNQRVDDAVHGLMNRVHRLREDVRSRFATQLEARDHAGVLIALAVGDQRAIGQAHWQTFRSTGVAHLVSISGLHVSLVAVLAGVLAGWAWRRSAWLMLRLPARKAAVMAGLVAACAYALMAGLGLPTQRALIMLAVGAGVLLAGRAARPLRALSLALLGVLLVDPWAVLAAGFWLSFGAVAAIIYVAAGRMEAMRGWRGAVRVQIAITLFTVPLLLALFDAFPLVSPLANALAIPLVSFAIAPLALLAIIVPWPPLLVLAHALTSVMMHALDGLAGLPFALWRQAAPPTGLLAVGCVGMAWLLMPRGTPARVVGVLALLPLLAWSPPRPLPGGFVATVLDVGNGMAVHVQTANRDLIYDTGPPYGPDADAGERVLLPYLGSAGVRRIDRLVLSHDDADHTGGAAALLGGIAVDEIVSGFAPEHRLLTASAAVPVSCRAGEVWEWDGVRFELLHPSAHEAAFRKNNDNSCVLRVVAAGGAMLLSGDIEGPAERSLLARSAAQLASEVVLVPHHGSRSSSTPGFVRAVAASHAIHAVGNLNPFGHPHPQVLSRWEQAGARNWRTDRNGAIIVRVDDGGVAVTAHRMLKPRYWHGG